MPATHPAYPYVVKSTSQVQCQRYSHRVLLSIMAVGFELPSCLVATPAANIHQYEFLLHRQMMEVQQQAGDRQRCEAIMPKRVATSMNLPS